SSALDSRGRLAPRKQCSNLLAAKACPERVERSARATRALPAWLCVRVIRGVLFQKLLLVLRQFLCHEDRIRGANRNAGAAIDATSGVDINLCRRLKLRLVFFGMDAVGRADVHAKLVLDASVGDYIGHECFS